MFQIIKFTGAGATKNINVGFVPDYVEIIELAGTNSNVYKWSRKQHDEGAASSGKYGLKMTGATGVYTYNGSAAAGIVPLSAASSPSPVPTRWAATTNYALGDYVKPTTNNGFIYKVTTDGGSSGATEPTWPTTVGDTVVDDGITWTCCEDAQAASGQYGIQLGASLATNAVDFLVIAHRADMVKDA